MTGSDFELTLPAEAPQSGKQRAARNAVRKAAWAERMAWRDDKNLTDENVLLKLLDAALSVREPPVTRGSKQFREAARELVERDWDLLLPILNDSEIGLIETKFAPEEQVRADKELARMLAELGGETAVGKLRSAAGAELRGKSGREELAKAPSQKSEAEEGVDSAEELRALFTCGDATRIAGEIGIAAIEGVPIVGFIVSMIGAFKSFAEALSSKVAAIRINGYLEESFSVLEHVSLPGLREAAETETIDSLAQAAADLAKAFTPGPASLGLSAMEICVKVAYRARRRLRYNRVNQALRSGARDKAAWQAAFRKYPEIAIWVPFLPTVVPASLAGFLPPLNVDQHAAAEAASRGTAAPSVSLLTEFYQAIDEVDPDKVKKNKSFLSQFSCVSASDGDLVVRAKTKPFWLMSHAPLVVVKQLDDVKIESPQVLEAARIRTYRLLRLAEKHQADALCVLTLNGQPLHKPLKKDVAPYTEVQVFGRASPSTNLLPSMQGPEPGVAGRPPTSFSRDPVADPLAEHVTNLPGTPLPEGVE